MKGTRNARLPIAFGNYLEVICHRKFITFLVSPFFFSAVFSLKKKKMKLNFLEILASY